MQDQRAATSQQTSLLLLGVFVLVAAGVVGMRAMLHGVDRPWDLVDFAVYRAGGRAITHHHSLYGSWLLDHLRDPHEFLYPPFAAMLFVPFTYVSATGANIVWTLVNVALLALVVRRAFAALIAEASSPALAFVLTFAAVLALAPIEEDFHFGQIAVLLMALCFFDCIAQNAWWPRGALVGIATAIKLVPGLFIVYLWVSGRRAAAVATGWFAGASVLGAVVAPADSWHFVTDRMLHPVPTTYFANQSLRAIIERAIGNSWFMIWLPAVIVLVVLAMRSAVRAHQAGDELRAVAIVGLVSLLIAPVSWLNQFVWVVPALAVIVGSGRDRRRVILALGFAALLCSRLPYDADSIGNAFLAGAFKSSHGLISLGLLVVLCRSRTNAEPAAMVP